MGPEAASVCGLKLLVSQALSWCMRLTYCDIGYDLRAMDYLCQYLCFCTSKADILRHRVRPACDGLLRAVACHLRGQRGPLWPGTATFDALRGCIFFFLLFVLVKQVN